MERSRSHQDERGRQRGDDSHDREHVDESHSDLASEQRAGDEHSEHGRGLLDTPTMSRIESQWSDIKLRFVDDPRGALDEAFGLLEGAFEEVSQRLRHDYDRIRDGVGDKEVTTEDLRRRLHECKSLLDRLAPPSLH